MQNDWTSRAGSAVDSSPSMVEHTRLHGAVYEEDPDDGQPLPNDATDNKS